MGGRNPVLGLVLDQPKQLLPMFKNQGTFCGETMAPDFTFRRHHDNAATSRVCTVLLDGTQTADEFSIVEQNFKRGQGSQRHRHTRESHAAEILLGSFSFEVNDNSLVCRSGDWLHIPKGVWHSFIGLEDTNAMRLTIVPAGLEKLIIRLNDHETDPEVLTAMALEYGVEFEPTR